MKHNTRLICYFLIAITIGLFSLWISNCNKHVLTIDGLVVVIMNPLDNHKHLVVYNTLDTLDVYYNNISIVNDKQLSKSGVLENTVIKNVEYLCANEKIIFFRLKEEIKYSYEMSYWTFDIQNQKRIQSNALVELPNDEFFTCVIDDKNQIWLYSATGKLFTLEDEGIKEIPFPSFGILAPENADWDKWSSDPITPRMSEGILYAEPYLILVVDIYGNPNSLNGVFILNTSQLPDVAWKHIPIIKSDKDSYAEMLGVFDNYLVLGLDVVNFLGAKLDVNPPELIFINLNNDKVSTQSLLSVDVKFNALFSAYAGDMEKCGKKTIGMFRDVYFELSLSPSEQPVLNNMKTMPFMSNNIFCDDNTV